jgi:peptidoglycan hydrolase CwlO-like protein
MNIHTATAVMLCLATLTTGACVTRSTYDKAVDDLEATQAELSNTRTQSKLLTEQVSELQQQKFDIARKMEATSAAFRQATQEREAERAALEQRLSTLKSMIRQQIAQQNSLRYALQRENNAQPTLQSLVDRYKSKLGEAGGSGTPPSTSPAERTDQPAETALAPPVTTPAAPADPTAANPTPQPENKQTSDTVDEGWLSMFRGWVISLVRSIFS